MSRKAGKIFVQKYCEHVVMEVKIIEDQKISSFFVDDQAMKNHAQNKHKQLSHAPYNNMVTVSEISLGSVLFLTETCTFEVQACTCKLYVVNFNKREQK